MRNTEAAKVTGASVPNGFTLLSGNSGSTTRDLRWDTKPKNRIRSAWFRTVLLILAVCAIVGVHRAAAQTAATESSFYAFCAQGSTTCPDGSDPVPGVIQASDGNFYGETVGGGSAGYGTIFKITPSGTLTTIYNFCQNGCTIGGQPNSPLIEGSDGNFYGVSYLGGTYNAGDIYKITPSGTVTVLYNFCSQANCPDGEEPMGSLVLGSDGNFYGTTYAGGDSTNQTHGGGTIFKITPSGQLTTLYKFCSQANCPDGLGPITPLVQGSDGDFYGMTAYGGANAPPTSDTNQGGGTIFKITPSGQLTTLHSFCSNYDSQTAICVDGNLDYPSYGDGLTEGSDGNMYGTTYYGGPTGFGTIFKITPSGTYTVMHSFCSISNCPDGEMPMGSLVEGSDGNFYGVTWYGGIFFYSGDTAGIAYQMTPSGTFTVLHNFCSQGGSACTDGAMPRSAPVQGNNGDLYGSAPFGGIVNSGGGSGGILYEMALNPALSAPVQLSFSSGQVNLGNSATLSWKVLNGASTTMQQCYAFVQNNATGAGTWTGLQTGTASNGVYSGAATITPTVDGTYTYALTCGGTESGYATLTVGGVTPLTISTTSLPAATVGAGYSQTLVATGGATPYTWSISSASGSLPAGLSLNPTTGVISGTPTTAGTSAFTVQVKDSESTPATTTASLSITVNPAPLVIGTTSLLAATVNTAYSQTLAASGGTAPYTWSLATGSLPAGLNLNTSTGAITGTPTTAGTSSFTVQVKDSESTPASTTASLSITVNAAVSGNSATESIVYAFCPQGGGSCPAGSFSTAGMIQDSDGNYYGTTETDGPNNNGTVFKVTPAGQLTTVYSFCSQANCTDGAVPATRLIEGSDGSVYGTTSEGGTISSNYPSGSGVVFKISPAGTLTILHTFCSQANCADGSNPSGALVLGKDGNIYGTTFDGGNTTNTSSGGGTIFKITPSGTFTTLYSFCSLANCADGNQPGTALVQGSDGDFYGMTAQGGTGTTVSSAGAGTVFKITPSGQFTTLYNFCSVGLCSDGQVSDTVSATNEGLVEGSDGNFYGTTQSGGANDEGTAFKITPSGVLTTLYSFCSQTNCVDGFVPNALIEGSDGDFYGTTTNGGVNGTTQAAGTAFQLTPSGALTTLYSFCSQGGANCTDGSVPNALIQGSDGNLYGTTAEGGDTNPSETGFGTIFKLTLAPGLTAPVHLSFSSGQINLGNSATLSWQVLNGASTTMQQCYAFVRNNATGAGSWTGLQTGTANGGVYSGTATITPTVDGTYTYALTCGGTESGFATLTVGGTALLTISTTSLPSATVNTAYSQTLAASGGTAPYTWSISSGSLPAGLSLNASTGAISGTLTTAGISSFTVQVKDSESTPVTTTASLSITVNPAALAISTSSLPAATVNTAYSQTLAASGGTAPYTWSLTTGSLPTGLSLNGSTGTISGTPTTAGTSNFTVQVQDSESTPVTTTASLNITVNAAVAPGYSLSANPNSLNIVDGQSGTTVITLTPVGGFSGTVTINCSGLPSYATCSFNPASLSPNGSNTKVSTTLTIATDVSTTASLQPLPPNIPPTGGSAPLLAAGFAGYLVLLFGFRKRIADGHRLRGSLLILLLSIGCLTMASGCGGSSTSSSNPAPVTPPGTYSVVVSASAGAGATAQTMKLNITITQ